MTSTIKIKQWGNSLGLIIPSDLVNDLGLNIGEEVVVDINKKQNVLQEMFGAVKFKRKTSEIIKDIRKEWASKWI